MRLCIMQVYINIIVDNAAFCDKRRTTSKATCVRRRVVW